MGKQRIAVIAGDVSATGAGVGVVGGAEASGEDGEFWDVGSARSGSAEVGSSGVVSAEDGMSRCQPGRMRSGSVRRRPSACGIPREASKIRGHASASSRCCCAISLSVSPLTTVYRECARSLATVACPASACAAAGRVSTQPGLRNCALPRRRLLLSLRISG